MVTPHLYWRDLDTALQYAERGLEMAQTLHLIELLPSAYAALGNVLTRFGETARAENSLRQAMETAESLGFASYERLMATGRAQSLDGAPMLLPVPASAMRRELDDWFERTGVRPRVVAEFDDSALLKTFGAAGAGVFPAPYAIASEIERMYSARAIGVADGVRENYVVISPERRLKQPALLEIIDRAREQLFQAAETPP